VFCTFTFFFSYISILSRYRKVVYDVTDAFQKSFSSIIKSSVSDFGYSFLLFSDRISLTVARSSYYSLQSQCYFVCSPSQHSHSALDTMLNLFMLALRLVWPALIRFIHTKARRFILFSRNHGAEPFLQYVSKCLSPLPRLVF
jgi:hypothetical protein